MTNSKKVAKYEGQEGEEEENQWAVFVSISFQTGKYIEGVYIKCRLTLNPLKREDNTFVIHVW